LLLSIKTTRNCSGLAGIHASFSHDDGIGKHIPDRCHEFCEALPLFEFHRVWIPVVIGGMPEFGGEHVRR